MVVSGPEYVQVEAPLLRQLEGMGWEYLEGAPDGAFKPRIWAHPGAGRSWKCCWRNGLRVAVRTINLGDLAARLSSPARPAQTPWSRPLAPELDLPS
ncbi:hypothetical protein GCM10022254_66650 [Actinomadura meridiana]|uniref:Uncharacterized protein n=1 Tax=Actinomadura meridiana TaxID=559626 RepID=A0ABP8CL99_9ACTN